MAKRDRPLWQRPVSRRGLLFGGGGALLLANLPGSSVYSDLLAAQPAPSMSLNLVRREDMLKLRYDFYNLKIATSTTPPQLVPEDVSRQSLIAVQFDAQHVMEETTFIQTQGGTLPPASSFPAPGALATKAVGPSRLVFLVPRTAKALPFTEEGLLSWPDWVMQVVAASQPGMPTAQQTDLLLTDWLHLTPEQTSSWLHVNRPITSQGRTELWHTRLVLRDEHGKPNAAAGTAPIRAVAADTVPKDSKFRSMIVYPDDTSAPGQIVVQSNADTPVDANLVLLSAQGSSLDLAGEWGGDQDIAQWRHLSSIGRDNYVRIEKRGFLFPYGHRAVLVTETERTIAGVGGAYLVQRAYIRITEPVKQFADNAMPFTEVRIAMSTTPNLAAKPAKIVESGNSFWVQYVPAGGTDTLDVPFPLTATDWAGNKIDFTAFLAFLPKDEARGSLALEELRKIFSNTKYGTGDLDARRTHSLDGQQVAFAPTAGVNSLETTAAQGDGATTYPATEMYMSVGEPDDGARWRWLGQPAFLPKMMAAKVRLPAVETLAGKPISSVIGYDPAYLAGSFDAVKAEVFARVQNSVHSLGQLLHSLDPTSGIPTPFGQEVSAAFTRAANNVGGIATPNLEIGALSRSLGPLSGPAGTVADIVKNGSFNPKDFFPKSAKLLGGITLGDLLDVGSPLPVGNNSPKIVTTPIYPGGDANQPPEAIRTTLDWVPQLPTTLTAKVFVPNLDGRQASMTLHSETFTTLGTGTTTSTTSTTKGELRDFAIELIDGSSDSSRFIRLGFKRFTFESRDNAKPQLNVELASVSFLGPLKFINTLQRFLVNSGKGLSIDVQPAGIQAGYTLAVPDVGIGVFALQHLAFSAALNLPFDGSAARARFAFCSREHPFTLTVSLFGGGGFLALALGTDGFESLEASLEFGGSVAFNLGVASGSVAVMAGIYFKLEVTDGTENVTLTGYVRATGQLNVLGLITISAEFYLGLSYTTATNVVEGEASLTVEIDILFFSKSVTLRVHKSFAGPGGSLLSPADAAGQPKFGDLMSQDDWNAYCDSFAA